MDGAAKKASESGTQLLATGVGVGAVGALGALALGAVCPLCIVATPALVGAGLVQKLRAWRLGTVQRAAPVAERADVPTP